MIAAYVFADILHGTPTGFEQGCKSSGGCPAVVPCKAAALRYRGDTVYRKRVDAGMTPEQILEAELNTPREPKRAPAKKRRKVVAQQLGQRARDTTPIVRVLGPAGRLQKPKKHGAQYGGPHGIYMDCKVDAECPAKIDGGMSCRESWNAYHKVRRAIQNENKRKAGA